MDFVERIRAQLEAIRDKDPRKRERKQQRWLNYLLEVKPRFAEPPRHDVSK